MSKSKVLFLMSGSIAAFKACSVISKLVQDGNEVQVVVTPSTLQFVGPATLEGLTGRKVLSDTFEHGHAMDHIHLTRWADFAVLCPASANTLAKLAHGFTDDLVAAMALAWPSEKPFHIFPAMNTQMLQSAPTQTNLELLKARGFKIAPTDPGSLACGENGEGRLLEPERILQLLQPKPTAAKLGRVLVTAGATREPIDGIRFISNVSTGQTGADLASELTARGWQVTFLHGQGAIRPPRVAHALSFSEFSDLERKLRAELDQRDYAGVIHAAAVSDYTLENADRQAKISSGEPLTLNLKPNPKLLPRLKQFSRHRGLRVIGFKLTLNAEEALTTARARDLLGSSVDAVVANDWSQVDRDRTRHPGRLVTSAGETPFENVPQLAGLLHNLLLSTSQEKSHDLRT